MHRAAIYTRISQDHEGNQAATARQLEDCVHFIASRQWEHAGTYEDPDISAFDRRATRPSFERLKADIVAGKIDVVVAWKLDRLWRRARDFADLDEACETAGARIVTVVDGIDTATSAGRLVATMMTGVARAEAENLSIRQRRKQAQLAREGKISGGGWRLFGYERLMKGVVEGEAAMIRDAVARVLGGESVSSVCRDWNARGLVTTVGNPWQPGAFTRTLSSPQMAGRRFYQGVYYEAVWPGIISIEEHERLLRLIGSRKRGPAAGRSHYLSGIMVCAGCEKPLHGMPTTRGARGYGCQVDGCYAVRRKAEPLEEFVRDLIFAHVEAPGFAELVARQATPDEDVDDVLAVIREDEVAIEELTHDRYVARVLGPAEFAAAHAALSARLSENRGRLAAMAPKDTGIDLSARPVRESWERETVEWRHRLASWLIERVTAGRSPRGRLPFHAASIEVKWRF